MYYTLVVYDRDSKAWLTDFGDPDRAVVVQEVEDRKADWDLERRTGQKDWGIPKRPMRIIVTEDELTTSGEIDRAVLNWSGNK